MPNGVGAGRPSCNSVRRVDASLADRLAIRDVVETWASGRWGMVLRQPIYEKDRIDPVDPGATLTLDPELLARFPEGYRHLAYLQVRVGYPVKPDMPGVRGPEVDALYQRGAAWLAGEPVAP